MAPEDDPHAPAVNHAGGIARLMGDNALFARVLARFRNEYRQTAAGIRTALGNGDGPQALRLVHTLKGAAGMIEAVPLRHAAQALEQVLRQPDGGGDAWQRLARLEQALDRVLLELDAAAAVAPPAQEQARAGLAQGAKQGRKRARSDTVRRLATLLDDGNGEAVDLVREAAGTLAAQLGEQRYRRLADTIEAFDFDGALAMLAEWT
ncbi:Hpt domain-containing protein [Herbaspirillum sp. SJZ107]|uniref:Hpt domain-containing protein n=1 Tax=Herbaspirillum sp. SJZ107 TaxID=2572881 RepID=UPI00114F631B|nr:Hpt domain-containing protein [Herbaspirillum sp. SJZ107]TQK05658.1 HPt (histidine-containing phosphotransfer) domain-containing protein [Herbaspirillum sp. SJZ107]